MCRSGRGSGTAMSLQRWFYAGGRPNWMARLLDRGTAAVSARGRSGVLGRLGGVGPTVGAERQAAGSRGRRRWRALPRVHARRRSELGTEREGGGGRGRLASWSSRGCAPVRSGRARTASARAESLLEAGAKRQRTRADRQGCAARGVREGAARSAGSRGLNPGPHARDFPERLPSTRSHDHGSSA